MQDALLFVSEDWRGPILGCLFFALLVLLGVIGRNTSKNRPSAQSEPKPFVWYRFLAVCFCLYTLDIAFCEALFLLNIFPESALFGWAAIGLATAYVAAFFRSVCLLTALQPGALRLTRMFLISFAPFVAFFPFGMFALCVSWMGEGYVFSDYIRYGDWGIIFFAGCLFSLPWLLYFLLSSDVKKMAL